MSNSSTTPASLPAIPKRILIIGGGPCGLVALRNLVERGKFEYVELWERRDDVGGVWYLDESQGTEAANSNGRWPSPAYKGLIGNVLPEFLSFSGFPFPKPTKSDHQPFPTLDETYTYLREFSEPYTKSGNIKLKREVVSVEELGSVSERGNWKVTAKDWTNGGKQFVEYWDAVVVAVGHYDYPVWPAQEGLDDLRQAGLAVHSKYYEGPQEAKGKKVLVIGNANSSNDIAAQVSSVSNGPLFQSTRRPNWPGFPALASERINIVAPVSKYILHPSKTKFDALLTDGTTISDLDVVYCGTGYRPLANFVSVLDPSDKTNTKLVPLNADPELPYRIPSLHRLIMYAHNPTLGFVGSVYVYTPFIIADIFSTWLALAWSNVCPYPSTPAGRLQFEEERLATIKERQATMADNPTSFLTYSVLAQDEHVYANALRKDIVEVRPELDAVLPTWTEERLEARELMFKMKYTALEYARDHPEGPEHRN